MSEDHRESQELHEYRLRARAWLAENVPSAGVRTNPEEEFESDPQRLTLFRLLQQKLHQAGYAGFTFSKEYGGQGLTLEHERVFLEEAAGYDIPGRNFGVSINILGATLARFGSPEQKLEHIPKILSGEELWIQLLSEPSGGSDLAGLLTGATRDGDSFLVNGQKTWSSGAALSDFALCPVRTRWDVPKHKGISMLIVDLGSPGIEVRRIKQIDGRADFCEEFFADVVVRATNLVGEENEGWRVARGLLEIEHSWAGRSRSRVADGGRSVAPLVSLAATRGLGDDAGVRRGVVDLHVASVTQRLLSERVSRSVANGKLPTGYGSLVKLGNDVITKRRAELALALAGADAVTWPADQANGDQWSEAFLHSRSATIRGGTVEIQRNNVSDRVLGLPREPASDVDLPFDQVQHN